MHLSSLLLMSGGLTQGLQLFFALSILIALHEFGHYFFARLFKTRVEKFYLFFDFLFPFSGVLNFSLFKKKIGETTYGVGWFPLGGYVKISGMVDESMDKDQMQKPPEPWEYRSKPAWQRLFIMLGGIIVNVLLAMLIYAFVFGVWGEDYLPAANAKYGISVDSIGNSIGLQDGDKITAIDGKPVDRFNSINRSIIFDKVQTISVDRNGTPATVTIPSGTIGKMIKAKTALVQPRIPIVVNEVADKTAAQQMQLLSGDSIIAVNGVAVSYYDEFDSVKNSLKGKPIRLTVVRNGTEIAALAGTVPTTGILGFRPEGESRFFNIAHVNYNPIEALGKGFTYTGTQFGFYWKQFKMIFTSKEIKVTESVGGIASFGKLFPEQFNLQSFLMLLAFVSIILAFMNLLPIPGLDGGYVFFLLFEIITGKQVPQRVMEIATTVGLVLLLALMLFANGLDLLRGLNFMK